MKILALDSTAQVASVALCDDDRLLAEYTINNGNTHSATLLPMIESVLGFFGIDPSDIDLFAASAGPGSFTGVRIGAATLKGIAFDRKKPCIGVSTLEALAMNLSVRDGLIVPVMNARRNQVYTAVFRSETGILTRLSPDEALAISELDERLKEYGEPVSLVGDGYELVFGQLTHAVLPVPERLRHQSAYSVAQAARQKFLSGVSTDDAGMVPTYLRPSQAERERNARIESQKIGK